MIVGSTKEDLLIEKRVSLTPETAKSLISLGLKVLIEKNYAEHLGIKDQDFQNVGVEVKNSPKEGNWTQLIEPPQLPKWIYLYSDVGWKKDQSTGPLRK